MKYLFAKLLTNDDEYSLAENFWARLFDEIAEGDRRRHGWQSPWFKPRPPRDGNPVFTAVSEVECKAIRVIQYQPTCDDAEFDFWFDTFGGETVALAARS